MYVALLYEERRSAYTDLNLASIGTPFSILKKVKNWQRSTIGQDKLSSLSVYLLAIEHELLREIDRGTKKVINI